MFITRRRYNDLRNDLLHATTRIAVLVELQQNSDHLVSQGANLIVKSIDSGDFRGAREVAAQIREVADISVATHHGS